MNFEQRKKLMRQGAFVSPPLPQPPPPRPPTPIQPVQKVESVKVMNIEPKPVNNLQWNTFGKKAENKTVEIDNGIKLSILIITVPNRLETYFPRLIRSFEKQIGSRKDVEILGLYDNKKRTIGEKRNFLLSMASGKYLTFVDDDDRVGDTYIDDVMGAIESNPNTDCVLFDCITTINGKNPVHSKYGTEYIYSQVGDQWRGKPAHTMVWKSEIAKKHIYKHKNLEEDVDWVKRACLDIKHETRIDKILYFYDFNSSITETR